MIRLEIPAVIATVMLMQPPENLSNRVPELEGTGMVSIYSFSLNIDPNEGL